MYYASGELPQIGDVVELTEKSKANRDMTRSLTNYRAEIFYVNIGKNAECIGIESEIIPYKKSVTKQNVWHPSHLILICRRYLYKTILMNI